MSPRRRPRVLLAAGISGLAAVLLGGCAVGGEDLAGIDAMPNRPRDGGMLRDAGGGSSDAGSDAGVDLGVDLGLPPVQCPLDLPNACANASGTTITVAPGGIATVSGVVDSRGPDYFIVEYTGVANTTSSFHPVIALTTNPNDEYRIDVQTVCGTPAQLCSTAVTSYEMTYPGASGNCDLGGNCTDDVARRYTLIVRVSRLGTSRLCDAYTVTISNVP